MTLLERAAVRADRGAVCTDRAAARETSRAARVTATAASAAATASAATAASANASHPNVVLGGRYRLGSQLGGGSEAYVKEAWDLDTGKAVAVKIFRSTDSTDNAPFRRELDIHGRLRHKNIVRVLDSGDTHDPGVTDHVECLTGTKAFPGPPLESMVARTLGEPRIPGTVRRRWSMVLHAMTDPNPAGRPSASQAVGMLRRLSW
ncbi:protein kinase domain-containing protein [Arthrobacter sp. ISL-95]|uniref:protein kinase domain-containing protein n=1 Tax=Arthrobacter sp. ISL-95 TaxID=2819116 RepID=UPI001BE5F9A0|nr:hypothetical protein [Arthrobacter sp. ISL-95]MBT2588251.1 hypothetical protein [Arthrobacter sp. ISL-95]